MNEEQQPSVLGALPHSRPHRRSAKRETRPVSAETTSTETGGTSETDPTGAASETDRTDGAGDTDRTDGTCGMGTAELVTTVVQAAAELAEIGLTAGARALRIAVSRLPRP